MRKKPGLPCEPQKPHKLLQPDNRKKLWIQLREQKGRGFDQHFPLNNGGNHFFIFLLSFLKVRSISGGQ